MSTVIHVPPSGGDDRAALQAALDAAGDYGVVELEPATYYVSGPLFFKRISALLTGRYDAKRTTIQCTGSHFPAIVRLPEESMSVPTDGDALLLNGSYGQYINLTADCWFFDIDGLGPWSCEFDLWLDEYYTGGGTANILACQGMRGMTTDTFRQAFGVDELNGLLHLTWRWGPDGSGHIVSTTPLPIGGWSRVKVEFTGSEARLSVNGVVEASQPAGPIRKSWHEDLCVGSCPLRYPDGSTAAPSVKGKMRDLTITGSSIYPGHTGTLRVPFEQCDGPMVPIDTGFSRHWTPYRRAGGWSQVPVQLQGFTVKGGTGIYLNQAVNSRIEKVSVDQAYNGIILNDNCYKSVLRDIFCGGSGRIGIGLVGSQVHLCNIDEFQVQHFTVGVMCSDGSGSISNGFIYGGRMKAAVVVKGDWPIASIRNVSYGDEGQNFPPEFGIYASNVRGLEITGGGGTNFIYPIPLVTLENCSGVAIGPWSAGVAFGCPGVIDVSAGDVPDQVVAVSRINLPDVPLFVPH